MTIYIALLRGINVSGQKLIKMAELKRMFDEMGFARVQTYIQSGNVLFESVDAAELLRPRIEHEIGVVFGFPVTVVLRTAGELEQIIRNCPFTVDASPEGESLYVSLLAESPSRAGVDRLLAYKSDVDDYRIAGREVYILFRQSVRNSMFSNNFLERKLGVPATSRNWRTISRLADMVINRKPEENNG